MLADPVQEIAELEALTARHYPGVLEVLEVYESCAACNVTVAPVDYAPLGASSDTTGR